MHAFFQGNRLLDLFSSTDFACVLVTKYSPNSFTTDASTASTLMLAAHHAPPTGMSCPASHNTAPPLSSSGTSVAAFVVAMLQESVYSGIPQSSGLYSSVPPLVSSPPSANMAVPSVMLTSSFITTHLAVVAILHFVHKSQPHVVIPHKETFS